MPPKGEFEITYLGWDGKQRVPCAGLDYSAPYNCLPQNSLAPGTVNTQSINGFLCSSPLLGSSPFTGGDTILSTDTVLGISPFTIQNTNGSTSLIATVIVTLTAVYVSYPTNPSSPSPVTVGPSNLKKVYTWNFGETDINLAFVIPGQTVSFVQVEGTLYFTGLMFNGIYSIVSALAVPESTFTFTRATSYVCAAYLFMLDGYMCAASCRFPTGGGTGNIVSPTIAWSVPGGFTTWDPTVDARAGYNQLDDVSDRITGVATEGRSAFIFRLYGITEQDPNLGSNAGLQPFIWYHLWASPQGVGAVDNTVAQYGEVSCFLSSDNVYSISLSGGVQQIGSKIISKINTSNRSIGAYLLEVNPNTMGTPYTYHFFASFVVMGGQLHYLLNYSWSYNNQFAPEIAAGAYVYDLNVGEQSWHLWDLTQYVPQASGDSTFTGFTTPIVQVYEVDAVTITGGFFYSYAPVFILCGGTSVGETLNPVFQFIPLRSTTAIWQQIYAQVLAPLYPTIEMPQTTLVFRGETVSSGHKITLRRVRIQADNVANVVSQQTSQIAQVKAQGENQSILSPPVNLTPKATGAPIQTYYADAVLSDEVVQVSITTPSTAYWAQLCTFRLAHVSFIGVDPSGSTA